MGWAERAVWRVVVATIVAFVVLFVPFATLALVIVALLARWREKRRHRRFVSDARFTAQPLTVGRDLPDRDTQRIVALTDEEIALRDPEGVYHAKE